MHSRLSRKGTLEKLQKIPPKVAIFTMKQHHIKKNKYSESENLLEQPGFLQ